jgi:hypothetical protein
LALAAVGWFAGTGKPLFLLEETMFVEGSEMTTSQIAKMANLGEHAIRFGIAKLTGGNDSPAGMTYADKPVIDSIRKKAGNNLAGYTLKETAAILDSTVKVMREALDQAYAEYGEARPA